MEFTSNTKLIGKHDNLLHLPYQIGTYCGVLAYARTPEDQMVSRKASKLNMRHHDKCMSCYTIEAMISRMEALINSTKKSKSQKIEATPIDITTSISVIPTYNKKNKRATFIIRIRDIDFSKGQELKFRMNVKTIKKNNRSGELQLLNKSKRQIIVLINNLT